MAAQLTMLLLNPVIGLLLSATCLALWQFHRNQHHLLHAAGGYVMASAAFALQGFGSQLPYTVQIASANLLFLLAATSLFGSVVSSLGMQVPIRAMLAVVLAGTAALTWFLLVEPHLEARVVIISASLGALSLIGFLKLYRYPKRRKVEWLPMWVLLAAATDFFLLRPAIVLIFPDHVVGYQGLQQTLYWFWVQLQFAVLALLIALSLFAVLSSDVVNALRQEADTDKLSGLFNRRGFETRADHVLRARQRPAVVALLIADLDHFKRINDTYGHAAGDAVIAAFGEEVLHLLPGAAVAGRIGGEEFAVLLPGLDKAQAHEFAEALQAGLLLRCAGRFSAPLVPTASVGLVVSQAQVSLSELLGCADAALYHAKRGGRNQIVMRELDPGAAPAIL